MKQIINEILEDIGLEKIKINHPEAKAIKEPLKAKDRKKNINVGINREIKKV